MRSPEPRNHNRRPGPLPGRRFGFTLAFALAVATSCDATAFADQPVVSATLYPSSQGSVSYPSAGLQALGSCSPYDGSNPVYLYPAGQPYQLTTTAWSLSTVLTCGLHIPLNDLTSVQVLNPGKGFENPLSSADLTDPTQYHDPQSPDALPALSVDGSEDQTTYIRPFQGGSDNNGRDLVTESGSPITLVVYTNGLPLTVNASAHTLSSTATTTSAKFDATVHTAGGSPVPATALTWSWSFGDGESATAATPTHSFPAGSYDVAVQVTDASSGEGGTGTIQFTTSANPAPGGQTQGGGSKSNKSKSHTGTTHGPHGNRSAGKPGSGQASGSPTGSSNAQPSNQPTNPASPSQPSTPTTPASPTTSTAPAEATTTTTTTTTSSPPSAVGSGSPRRTASNAKPTRKAAPRTPPPALAGTLVTGRLISDVAPLPVGSSPLIHLAPAAAAAPPAVQQATRTTSLSALGAALVVGVLLGLGAWRELGGRRRSRAVLSGH